MEPATLAKEAELGAVSGVYIPVVLNVLSILMFLRFGSILGQIGLLGILGENPCVASQPPGRRVLTIYVQGSWLSPISWIS